MNRPIRTAVFPAAGLGTRFLPATRAIPKEMLTVVDQPVIQYAVAEAQEAGIERFIFVVAPEKQAIEHHFSARQPLEALLRERGQASALAAMKRGLPALDAVSFALQPAPLGLGHAVWCARDLVGNEPFAVLLPDVVLRSKPGCLTQVMGTYAIVGGNVVSVQECRPSETSRYGVVDPDEGISTIAFRIKGMVEKPRPGSAQSNLRLNGRYVLQPEVFAHLAKIAPGAGGELQLTDAVASLIGEQPVTGHRFKGRSFDCGSKEGFIAANIAFAMENPALASIIRHETKMPAPRKRR
jgi:UTP--glucose-1-phosphate uridylyltransferase